MLNLGLSLSKAIRDCRIRHRETQGSLAEATGLARQTIIKWEQDGGTATLNDVEKIANHYGLAPGDFLGLLPLSKLRKEDILERVRQGLECLEKKETRAIMEAIIAKRTAGNKS